MRQSKTDRDIKNLFEPQEEHYSKPVRAGNFYRNKYTKCESNGDRNKISSIKEHLDEIKPYLKDCTFFISNSILGVNIRIAEEIYVFKVKRCLGVP